MSILKLGKLLMERRGEEGIREFAKKLGISPATLSRIDNTTATVVKTIPLGHYPRVAYPVDLATGNGMVWVALH